MAAGRKVSIAMAVAVALAATAGRSSGQALAPSPVFPVEISATQPGVQIRLRGPGGDIPCGARCLLDLPQRDYVLLVNDAAGNYSKQNLIVAMPTRAAVTPPHATASRLGVASMLVGLAGMAAGGVLLYVSAVQQSGSGCNVFYCSGSVPRSRWIEGGSLMGVGLALGLSGLIVWRENIHPIIKTERL